MAIFAEGSSARLFRKKKESKGENPAILSQIFSNLFLPRYNTRNVFKKKMEDDKKTVLKKLEWNNACSSINN